MGIRKAVPSDLAAVLRINADGFVGDDPFDASWLVEKLQHPGTRLVVDDAGVGVIRGFLLTERYQIGTEVKLIAVHQQFRRQGVGSRLLSRVRGPAGAWVRKENAASRAMFTARGWEETAGLVEQEAPAEAHSGEWVYFLLSERKVK